LRHRTGGDSLARVPELPDVAAYVAALEPRVVGKRLLRIRIRSPFLLRSIDPPLKEAEGAAVRAVRRLGKRVVLELSNNINIVIHLMIAGRLHWKAAGATLAGRTALAAFDFEGGTLLLTEASTKKRASLHLVRGAESLADFDRGGIEPLEAGLPEFTRALTRENHTVKRALTDPRLFSGIGNAYSDEILHRARLSPAKWTSRLTSEETERLWSATRETLGTWTRRFVEAAGRSFPEKVTAFREGMAVHGRYGKPCPDCGGPVQRIVYAENESNYCPSCQTGGKLLADRALSQLLRGDWPKTLEELEERKAAGRESIDPLTPTLSPSRGRGRAHFHPLPAGEGRGEGTTARARDLRQRSSDAERYLWRYLRDRRLGGAKFRRQFPVSGYYLDFYCADARLAIELDGGQHAEESHRARDADRTAELYRQGIEVLRFWDNEVFGNRDGVLRTILAAIAVRSSSTL